MDTGLMQPQPDKSPTTNLPLLVRFKAVLSSTGGSPRTLEEKLAALSDTELQSIMQTAKFVQMAMQFKLAANDRTMGWPDLIASMYRGMGVDRRSLIAELLAEIDPLPFIPEPKAQRSSQEMGQAIYDRPEFIVAPVTEPTADDQSASTLESVMADAFPETRSKPQSSKVAEGKEAFLAAYTPVAKEIAEDLGVSYKVVLAQAALESGWGKSVKGNNLMGIKSHGEEGGLDVVTHEVVNGKRVKLTDSFRQYDSPEDSIRGYGKFLKANSRYKHFLRAGAENENAQLSALQSSGYATDPLYSQKLKNIIKGIPDEEGEI